MLDDDTAPSPATPGFACAEGELVQRLFTRAHTHSHWRPRAVAPGLRRELYELVRCGPTSMNTQPMRLKFVVSAVAKERVVACVNAGNVAKTQAAPVVVVVGQDLAFPDHLPRLFAHKADARGYFEGQPDVTAAKALRDSSLQGGYLILAARLLGLDCSPMPGFDAAAVDRSFWAGTHRRTNLLCNLGYGDPSQIRPRLPRRAFDEACEFV